MDKKIAGFIGAVVALSAGGAMAAAPNPSEILSARSFAELLQPIPNASVLLLAADAAKSNVGARNAQLAQYDDRDHQERDDVPPIVRDLIQPNDHHYHHHHHHHHYDDGED
jgi:hypothetical protein